MALYIATCVMAWCAALACVGLVLFGAAHLVASFLYERWKFKSNMELDWQMYGEARGWHLQYRKERIV